MVAYRGSKRQIFELREREKSVIFVPRGRFLNLIPYRKDESCVRRYLQSFFQGIPPTGHVVLDIFGADLYIADQQKARPV